MTVRLPRMTPANDGRLAYAVSQSETLTNLLPADELAAKLDAYDRAAKLAEAAQEIRFDPADAAEEVREALRTGTEVDVPAVVARMASDHAARDAHDAAAAFFRTLPTDARQEIVYFIKAVEDDLYDGLADQLTDVLDRAEPVVAALRGTPDADAAIEAKLTKQWSALKDLSRDYHGIVTAFYALLAVDDSVTTRTDPVNILFGGLADVAPTWASEAQRQPTDLRGRPGTDVPFEVRATDSVDHLRYVVENRSRLRPRIVRAAEALNSESAIVHPGIAVPGSREPGRFAPGSPEAEAMMSRLRRAGTDRIADQRREISEGLPV